MKWFKHFSDASTSSALEDLINEFGFEGYGRYWRLLELLSQKFDGESCYYRFHKRTLRGCMRFKSTVKLRCFMNAIGLQPGYKVNESKDHFEIDAPILLDLKDRDFKKSRKDREENAPKNKIKKKNKNKEKDIYISPPQSLRFEAIKQIWIELLPGKKATPFLVGSQRDNFLAAIGFLPAIENWREYFEKFKNSKFLSETPSITLTWAIDPENISKVLEGKYSNARTASSSEDEDDWEEMKKRLTAEYESKGVSA